MTEGFPVERGLEVLLNLRYNETLPWIERRGMETFEGHDDTIVEKIVSLLTEDSFRSYSKNKFNTTMIYCSR